MTAVPEFVAHGRVIYILFLILFWLSLAFTSDCLYLISKFFGRLNLGHNYTPAEKYMNKKNIFI